MAATSALWMAGAAGLALLLTPPAAAPAPDDGAPLRAVERPTPRQVARCFRGLTAPSVAFGMNCVLDAQGRPQQCEAYGLSEPQNRMVRSRVACIGEQFRYEAADGSAVEGRRINVPLNYAPQR